MGEQIIMAPVVEMTAGERQALERKQARLRNLRCDLRELREREEHLENEIADLEMELDDE